MTFLTTLRRSTWLAGALLLLLCAGIAAPLGWIAGLRSWPFYVGLLAAALLLAGWVERLWMRRPVRRAPPLPSKFKVLPGGKASDLRQDESADNPKWLM
jgi:4-hydroxybenzoate polyprenyltransferase